MNFSRHRRAFVLILGIVSFISRMVAAEIRPSTASRSETRQLTSLAADFMAAISRRDRDALARLLDDQFLFIDSTGQASVKSRFMADVLALPVDPTERDDLPNPLVRVRGDTAVLLLRDYFYSEKMSETQSIAVTCIRKGDTWRILAMHLSLREGGFREVVIGG